MLVASLLLTLGFQVRSGWAEASSSQGTAKAGENSVPALDIQVSVTGNSTDKQASQPESAPAVEKAPLIIPSYAELYPSHTPDIPPLTKEQKLELRDRGIYSGFGPRVLTVRGSTKRFHKGIDISAPTGSQIMAFNDGVVVFSSRHKSYGICVIIRQLDGRLARYAHMSKSVAKLGDEVTRGTIIGYVGRTGRATGSHLHFELLDDGEYLDPAEHIWLATELVKTPQELAMEEAEREALAENEKAAAGKTGEEQHIE